MNDLEQELRKAFHRKDPAAGFADRVMKRIPERRRTGGHWQRQWLAAAAAAVVAIVGAGAWEQHQRQIKGEQAKRELIYALTVASDSLRTTKHILTR